MAGVAALSGVKTPLIQALWGELQGVEWDKEALVKLLRKVVRKTDELKSSRVRPYLKQTPTRTS